MKRILSLFCFFMLAVSLSGQRNADFGVMGGVTSYLGDINYSRLLYSPGLAGGVFYRYNLHPRQALRADVIHGGISGSDLDFNNSFQQARAATFSGSVTEVALQFEFNFFPYSTQGKLWNYTPYFAAGAGAVYDVSPAGSKVVPVIPFSVGFKINIHKNIGLEAEYGFRKTFYDNFDALKDNIATSDYTWTHNNDWYTFTGLAITWKFFSKLAGCPAYGDVDPKRKR
jgi:hypothetical protein